MGMKCWSRDASLPISVGGIHVLSSVRYQEEQGHSEGDMRPASRASVCTDAELQENEEMTQKLTEMEEKFYPQDEYD